MIYLFSQLYFWLLLAALLGLVLGFFSTQEKGDK